MSEFHREIDAITASVLALQPELVTDVGAGSAIGFEADYRLEDLSTRGRQQLGETATAGLAALADLEAGGLSDQEQLSVDVLRWYLEDQVTMAEFVDYENPVNFITGAHANFPEFMADVHPIRTEADAENYVERLSQYPAQIRDLIARLEAADAAGVVPAENSLGIARWQIQNAIGNGDGTSHPMVTDLRSRIEAMPDENATWATGLVARASAIVEELIVPALLELDDAVRAIAGRSNQESGALFQPGGDEYYAAVLRHFISVDMTPEEVHQLGLEHVDRVVAELTVELDALGFDASDGFRQRYAAGSRRCRSDADDYSDASGRRCWSERAPLSLRLPLCSTRCSAFARIRCLRWCVLVRVGRAVRVPTTAHRPSMGPATVSTTSLLAVPSLAY